MLPVLISEGAGINVILSILGIKFIIGVVAGIIIDIFEKAIVKGKKEEEIDEIQDICEHDHCHCEEGILKSSLKHTLNIAIFIFIISLILNFIIYFIGEDALSGIISNKPILGPIISGLIGLIPNCASSVILTQLYIAEILSTGTMISGLLVNSGLGVLVLFRANKNLKENIKIVGLLYSIGVLSGILIEAIGIVI